MEIKKENSCVKFWLPNGNVVDVLSPILDEISNWLQVGCSSPESGGYIIGYQHKDTGNVSLENISIPGSNDIKTRIFFNMRDTFHTVFLKKAKKRKSYYMGVWHTHPQEVPIPSYIDWADWCETLRVDKTGCSYIFFIISGTKEWRLWIGDFHNNKIIEAQECKKDSNGLYIKGDES